MTHAVKISKCLSFWLRHDPAAGQIQVDDAGWAEVKLVLRALGREQLPHGLDDLQEVVAGSDKNRFELSPDLRFVRARQGHSIAVNLDWPQVEPPELLFHGTVERFLEPIFREGLQPRSRHHVHLSPDVQTATAVGGRRGRPVILRVAAGRMAADGHAFFLSSNGVWLADQVPPTYLERL